MSLLGEVDAVIGNHDIFQMTKSSCPRDFNACATATPPKPPPMMIVETLRFEAELGAAFMKIS